MSTTTTEERTMRQTITTCTTCGYGHVATIRCPGCDPRPHPRGGRMSTPELREAANRMEALVKRTRAANERGRILEAAMATDYAGAADAIDVSIAQR